MEDRCTWFVVWIRNRSIAEWYQVARFRSFASARRYADRVLVKYPSLLPQFKFEKTVYLNGSIIESDFIA